MTQLLVGREGLKEVETPFENTKVYLYYSKHGTLELVRIGYCGKAGIGVFYREVTSSIIPDTTAKQINTILSDEKQFDEQRMIELCRFLMAMSSNDEYWIFGDTSEGIHSDDMDTLSSLNRKYHSPKVIYSRSGISIEFICCLQDRGNIYNIVVAYEFVTKGIKVMSHDLGGYGRKRYRID